MLLFFSRARSLLRVERSFQEIPKGAIRLRSIRHNSAREMKGWLFFALPAAAALLIPALRGTRLEIVSGPVLQSFATIFLSIVLEAMPFVMLGVFVSSLIQFFVTEEMLARALPKRTGSGLLMASVLGFVFPICECCSVPVMRRLVRKGVPLHVGITFMMAAPIVNPVVLLSTYYAFGGNVAAAAVRAVLGMVGAMVVGLAATKCFSAQEALLPETASSDGCSCGCGHDRGEVASSCRHEHEHEHGHAHDAACSSGGASTLPRRALSLARGVLEHTGAELFSVGRFLVLGAFISSLAQTAFAKDLLTGIGQHQVVSVVAMMLLAFVLSLCSEADAFIARTFVGQFSPGAVMAFILLGPMIDIKNVLMLQEGFRKRFVLFLTVAAFAVCFVFCVAINIARL